MFQHEKKMSIQKIEIRRKNVEDKTILLANIDKIHTTEMGTVRIKKNLETDAAWDVVEYC